MKPRKKTDAEKAFASINDALQSYRGNPIDLHCGLKLYRALLAIHGHSYYRSTVHGPIALLRRSVLNPWEFKIVPKDAAS